jgi:hypothetical protein
VPLLEEESNICKKEFEKYNNLNAPDAKKDKKKKDKQ